MPGANKRLYVLKQIWSLKIQVCLSTYNLFYRQALKG